MPASSPTPAPAAPNWPAGSPARAIFRRNLDDKTNGSSGPPPPPPSQTSWCIPHFLLQHHTITSSPLLLLDASGAPFNGYMFSFSHCLLSECSCFSCTTALSSPGRFLRRTYIKRLLRPKIIIIQAPLIVTRLPPHQDTLLLFFGSRWADLLLLLSSLSLANYNPIFTVCGASVCVHKISV